MNVELIGNPDLTRKWWLWWSKVRIIYGENDFGPWRWRLNRRYWRGIDHYFDGWCDG